MARESVKHGPRLDDELKRETRPLEQGTPAEARSQEWREHEAPGDDERESDARPRPPGTLGGDAVEARRELSRHLRASVFPADRDALLAEAAHQGAPKSVVAAVRQLPTGMTFATVHEVWAKLEGHEDVREAAAHEPLTEGDR
jgi:hypothetical protein